MKAIDDKKVVQSSQGAKKVSHSKRLVIRRESKFIESSPEGGETETGHPLPRGSLSPKG